MRWDRRMAVFTAVALFFVILVIAALIFGTTVGIRTSEQRIVERAEYGFSDLMERVSDPENVGHPMFSRRGRFEDQSRYEAFDEAWLNEMVFTGHEYLEDEISYTYTLKLLLRTYDTENVYLPDDTRLVYGRYTDEVILFKDGATYYAYYRSGETEYRFIVECPPLTEWLDEISA